MTSVAREREGAGAPVAALWEETVRAVLQGFESAFGVTTRLIEPAMRAS
jgi:hypothetical protein